MHRAGHVARDQDHPLALLLQRRDGFCSTGAKRIGKTQTQPVFRHRSQGRSRSCRPVSPQPMPRVQAARSCPCHACRDAIARHLGQSADRCRAHAPLAQSLGARLRPAGVTTLGHAPAPHAQVLARHGLQSRPDPARPWSSVPVLSNTTVSASARRSSAVPSLISKPLRKSRPEAAVVTAGTARPSAQGQVMIRTAAAMFSAKSEGPGYKATSQRPHHRQDMDPGRVKLRRLVRERVVIRAPRFGYGDQIGDTAQRRCRARSPAPRPTRAPSGSLRPR
jgi:hypothetical protein